MRTWIICIHNDKVVLYIFGEWLSQENEQLLERMFSQSVMKDDFIITSGVISAVEIGGIVARGAPYISSENFDIDLQYNIYLIGTEAIKMAEKFLFNSATEV